MQGTATHLGASEMPSLKGAKRPNLQTRLRQVYVRPERPARNKIPAWQGENWRTVEGLMDWNFVEASWLHIRDEVHAHWGRLTSAHLDLIAGSRARLASKIEEAYGVTSNEAERQIKSFEARNQHPRPVSFR